MNYDYRDIKTRFTPNIPQDDLNTAQIISQLNGKLSTETGLSLLSFIDNPQNEIEKLKKEQAPNSIGAGLFDNSGIGGAA